jgi:hypothetical protein
LLPESHCRQRLELAQENRVATAVNERQEQKLLLDIRCEMDEVQDLADPRCADPAQTGQLALTHKGTITEQGIEVQRQSHPAADPRQPTCRSGRNMAARLGHRTGEGSFPVTQRDRQEARAAVVTHFLQQRPQALTLRDRVPFLPVISEQPLLLELFRHKALYQRRR